MLSPKKLHPGISVDCVIFGFHDNQLKVLLLRFKKIREWTLPGGFVGANEDVDQAAINVLKNRTALEKIFLTQFYLFGNVRRNSPAHDQNVIENQVVPEEYSTWFRQRFVTVGYYSLVEFSKVVPIADDISDACEWFSLEELPELILDHKSIIDRALWTLRTQLKYHPIGLNLLPEKFTMPELQALYETLLGAKLDRRNFQRKILGYGILTRLEERRTGGAHKAPYLYSFDIGKYNMALENGLNTNW